MNCVCSRMVWEKNSKCAFHFMEGFAKKKKKTKKRWRNTKKRNNFALWTITGECYCVSGTVCRLIKIHKMTANGWSIKLVEAYWFLNIFFYFSLYLVRSLLGNTFHFTMNWLYVNAAHHFNRHTQTIFYLN